eukprot:UN27951
MEILVNFEFPSGVKGHGSIHRSLPRLLDYNREVGTSIGEYIRFYLNKYANLPCLGHRTFLKDGTRGGFEFITFKEVGKQLTDIASGLVGLGLQKGDRVCIMAENREGWSLFDWACQLQGFIPVPLYDTLGPTSTKYIIEQCEAKAVVCSYGVVEKIQAVKAGFDCLEHIILLDGYPTDQAYIQKNKNKPQWTITASQVMANGK